MKETSFGARLLDFFFPRLCLVCGERLNVGERHVCLQCIRDLPRTHFDQPENPMEQLFWGRLEIDKGTCFFHYLPTSSYARIIAAFKYGAQPEVALTMGRIMAKAVHYPHFFEDIDYLIPVPLSKQRRRKRGYNQSEWLARGVSEVTGIPVCTDLVQRIADNPTQTRMSHLERAKNVEGIFAVNKADGMEGKHLLLIDDVITTGATLIACGTALAAIQDVHISVMTLTMAGK